MYIIVLGVTYPLDTVKTRLSVSKEKQSVATAVRKLHQDGGIARSSRVRGQDGHDGAWIEFISFDYLPLLPSVTS